MTTIASRTRTSGRNAEADPVGSALRTERTVSLIRVCVLAVVLSVYLSSLGIRRVPGPAAIAVLLFAVVYAFAGVLIAATNEGSSLSLRLATLLIDLGLITLWIQATGGDQSEFWTLYLIVIVATGLRFGMLETIAVSIGLAGLHSAALVTGGLETSQLYRPTLLIMVGFAVGVLSRQRAEHRRRSLEIEVVAESRARQLGRERAEVARLRRVDLARSEFIGVAAHELRTPLAAILGVLSTLKGHAPVLDDRVRVELIEGAEAQAERLSRLVEDLLTISRIEDGVLRLSMTEIDARALIGEAAQASATNERLALELDGAGSVVCDADAVIRVLTNLLDNARKYSPDGAPIVVTVSNEEERVRFGVRDAGPGIEPDDREAVFERFRRADRSGKPGAGLGLYICRGLVQAHGGELQVGESPEGGAEFSFWLPRRLPGEHSVAVGRSEDAPAPEPIAVDVSHVTAPAAHAR
jgi:signal transduction histidine kinase